MFENAIDMAHIHYLHNDTFGNQVTELHLVASLSLQHAHSAAHHTYDLQDAGLLSFSHSVQGQPQIRHMTCSTEPYGVTASFGLHNKPVNAMWEFSKVMDSPTARYSASATVSSCSLSSCSTVATANMQWCFTERSVDPSHILVIMLLSGHSKHAVVLH